MSGVDDIGGDIRHSGRPDDGVIAALATSQHGVLAAWQLYGLDYSEYQVCNRATAGRLHRSHRGVYAVGRRRLSTKGRWLAAVCAVAPGFPLVARAVAPGFDFADLELG